MIWTAAQYNVTRAAEGRRRRRHEKSDTYRRMPALGESPIAPQVLRYRASLLPPPHRSLSPSAFIYDDVLPLMVI